MATLFRRGPSRGFLGCASCRAVVLTVAAVAVATVSSVSPANASSKMPPGCVVVPLPVLPGDQICLQRLDWATAGFQLNEGRRGTFHRIHLFVDEYSWADSSETTLLMNVETCRRPNRNRPEPRFESNRCAANYYLKEIDPSHFSASPEGARLETRFGGQPLELEWVPEHDPQNGVPGRLLTEVHVVGSDAEFKAPATVTARSFGGYGNCSSWGEFGLGLEETHLFGRSGPPDSLTEPRRFRLLDAGPQGGRPSQRCGDPTTSELLRQNLRVVYDGYDWTHANGGALFLHLIEPGLFAVGSYVSVRFEDDSGLPTSAWVMFDKDRDNHYEERHAFCQEPEHLIRLPARPVPMVIEIQEGPCVYPRVAPARATTGSVVISSYR